ncbi:MAG: GTP-binding protein, partial [Pseudomonadota bacterium]
NSLARTEEALVAMSNGCICCTLRDDLLNEVRRLAADGRFDYLLIEGTGIAEPLPVAATFAFRDEDGRSLSDVAHLDTMVTVVDAVNLLRDYGSHDRLAERGATAGEGDARLLVDLIVDQIEFADVVVINKIADVSAEDRARVRKIVRALNADARVIETDHGRVAPSEILATGLFDHAKAETHPVWFKELHGFAGHNPETEEYGISSFVYRARRPFHPERFNAFLGQAWPGLIRAKGFFWLATRPDWVGEMSLAGAVCRTEGLGHWWASVPVARWPDNPDWRREMGARWAAGWGDRRQELVFIGAGLDEKAMRRALDDCLVGPERPLHFDADDYRKLADPFPEWRREMA